MRAGLLGHRVAVDEAVSSQSASGEPIVSWVTRATVWAGIEHLSGREALMAAQVNSDMTTRITIRWAPIISGINTRWRLRHGSRIYDILSIINVDEADERFVISCTSGKNSG